MAKLFFDCYCNKDYVMINTLNFKKGGVEYVLDRDTTEMTLTQGTFEGTWKLGMTWRNVYLWDGENENYLNEDELKELLKGTKPNDFYFDLEDDAPDKDYEVIVDYISV